MTTRSTPRSRRTVPRPVGSLAGPSEVAYAEPRVAVLAARRPCGRPRRPPSARDGTRRPTCRARNGRARCRRRRRSGACRADASPACRTTWTSGRLRPLDLAVDRGYDLLAALAPRGCPRVGEVVLHVDDEQRRAREVLDLAHVDLPRRKASHHVGRLLTSQGIALGRVQRDGVPVAVPQVPAAAVRRARGPGARHDGAAQRGARRPGRPRLPVLRARAARARPPPPASSPRRSTARTSAPTASPCGVCESCVAIAEGTSLDVIELDAASNNSVDDIRDLIEASLPRRWAARKKVYILDEVHMLTRRRSNALLKTLEEPPEHVVFVLATTDPQKVAAHDPVADAALRVHALHRRRARRRISPTCSRQEGVEADPEALAVIARAGAGLGPRRAVAARPGDRARHGRLDVEQVSPTCSAGTAFERRVAMLERWPTRTSPARSSRWASCSTPVTSRAASPRISSRPSRDAFLLTPAKGKCASTHPRTSRRGSPSSATALGTATLVRALETLGQAVVDMRGTDAADPRLVLEIALVRLDAPRRRAAAPGARGTHRAARAGGGRPARPAAPAAPAGAPAARRAPDARGSRRAPRSAAPRQRPRREPRAGDTPTPAPQAARADAVPDRRAARARRAEGRRQEPTAAAPTVDVDDVIVAWADDPPRAAGGRRAARGRRRRSRSRSTATSSRSACRRELIDAARPRFQDARPTTIRDALSRRSSGTSCGSSSVAARRVRAASGPAAAGRAAGRRARGRAARRRSTHRRGRRARRRHRRVESSSSRDMLTERSAPPSSRNATTSEPCRREPTTAVARAPRADHAGVRRSRGEPEAAQPDDEAGAEDAGRHGRGAGGAGQPTRRGSARWRHGEGRRSPAPARCSRCSIAPDVVDPDDVEMLEDLVLAAVGDGLRRAQELQAESMGGVTGGLDLGGLGGLGG